MRKLAHHCDCKLRFARHWITHAMAIVPFDGLARKLMLPLTALSAVGWLVSVIGFGIARNKFPGIFDSPEFYAYWAAAVVGPFVYICAVAHAALWRQISSIVGSVTAVLSIVYFTAMGTVMHNFGAQIYSYYHGGYPPILDPTISLAFAGSFIACLFWAGVLAMWPWYTTGSS